MIKRFGINSFSLLVALLCAPALSFAQTAAREYTTDSDRAGGVSVFGFYNPNDQKTYVLDGDPNSFAVPVTGSFSVSPAPVQYLRNGTATDATVDTATPTNNRPLPFSLFSGDGGNPASFGVGSSNSASLRVHVGNASDIPVAVSGVVQSLLVNNTSTPFTSTAQSGGKTSLDVAAYQAGTWNVGVTSSALPTGASTEATLSSLNGKVTAVDTGNVTVVSSALPTGGATAANQATGNASLSSIDGKLPALVSGRVPVDGSGVTQPISAASLPLPTDAATETTLQTLYATAANTDGSVTQLVSQGTLLSYFGTSYTNYASTSITTSAWVELFSSAAISANIRALTIFNGSSSTLELGFGGVGAEARRLIIPPGGVEGQLEFQIPASTRVSVRAIDANATTGTLSINLFQ